LFSVFSVVNSSLASNKQTGNEFKKQMKEQVLYSQCEEAARLWLKSKFPIAFTGAGISVSSGIPDFRSPGGLWSRYNPLEVATAEALVQNPKKVWEFLFEANLLFSKAAPNPAHFALAKLESEHGLQAVITQNIDNLHQEAGSSQVVEYHGNGRRFYCQGCYREYPLELALQLKEEDLPWVCSDCNEVIRPDIVFFGEQIPFRAQKLSTEYVLGADLVLVVGTSGEVAPASTLPWEVTRKNGKLLECNLGESAYANRADVRLEAQAEQALPLLEQIIAKLK
jgi:NAD-dependent deacetylase